MPQDKNGHRKIGPQADDDRARDAELHVRDSDDEEEDGDEREGTPRAARESSGALQAQRERERSHETPGDRAIPAKSTGHPEHTDYEGWSRDELYDKARELGLEGRSKWTKRELIEQLRKH